jgi:hypothetical protein
MVSKVQKAKEAQQYSETPRTCSNCVHYTSDREKNEYGFVYTKNKRCSIGGFAVKSMATCELHSKRANAGVTGA